MSDEMKQPIKWHQECLYSMKRVAQRKELELGVYRSQLDRLKQDIAVLEDQIRRATEEGKGGFDEERYCMPRNKSK